MSLIKPMPWIITSVLVGSFVIGLSHIKKEVHSGNSAHQVKAKKVAKNNTKQRKDIAHRFDFYTLLPKMKVEIPHYKKPEKLFEKFILQVASFKSSDDADKLKANLTLAGYDVQVDLLRQKDRTWYRVVVGPYDSKRKADYAQRELRRDKMDSIVRRMG